MVEKPKSSSEPEIVIEFKDPVLEAFYKWIPPEVLMSDDQFEVEITDEKVIVTWIKIRWNFIRSSSEEVDTDDWLLGEGNNSVKVPDTEMWNFKNPPEEYCQQPKN
jgi:hypothetical protein